MINQKQLMRQIMEQDFKKYELTLYLDTHPYDKRALELFHKTNAKARELREIYEANFGPITISGVQPCDSWTWIENPWPWEKEN